MSTKGITQLCNLDKLPIEAKELIFPFFDGLTDDDDLMQNIVGYYLVGSIASKDFHKTCSNVDFVVVTKEVWTDDALHKIRHLHKLASKKCPNAFCGYYITEQQLQAGSSKDGVSACTVKDGIVKTNATLVLDRVAMYELKHNGLLLYGKPIAQLYIDVDIKDVIAQLHDDVNTYWHKWLNTHKWPMPKGWSLLMSPKVSQYGVLGIARPLYTLRSGNIGSKHLAGVFLTRYFKDEHKDIIKYATDLRYKEGTGKSFSPARYKRTRAVMKSALEAFNKDYEKVVAQL